MVMESPGNAHEKVLESSEKPLLLFCVHPVSQRVPE